MWLLCSAFQKCRCVKGKIIHLGPKFYHPLVTWEPQIFTIYLLIVLMCLCIIVMHLSSLYLSDWIITPWFLPMWLWFSLQLHLANLVCTNTCSTGYIFFVNSFNLCWHYWTNNLLYCNWFCDVYPPACCC